MKQPAVTAYKDKISNKVEMYNNYAVILDPQYEPFILTQFDIFTLNLDHLYEEVRMHKAYETFKHLKRLAAFVTLLISLPLGITYFGLITKLLNIEIDSAFLLVMREMIYVAALAILVLWHDLSTNFDAQSMPRYPEIDDFILETLKQNTINFSTFKLRNPLVYMHPSTKQLLFSSIVTQNKMYVFNSEKLLKTVVQHEHVQRVLKRLEITDAGKVLMQAPISQDSAPTFSFGSLQSFILYATEQAILTKSFKIYPEHLLLALFNMFPVLKDILKEYHIDHTTFEKTIEWYIIEEQFQNKANLLDVKQPYYQKGGIVDSWVKGFTFFLDKISTNLSDLIISRGGLYGIGHTKEINYLISVLQKKYDANTILVGDPGVGKSSIIWGLTQRILDGDIPRQLRGLQVKSVDINKFLAISNDVGGISELVNKLSVELKNQVGTILYFDELEVLMNTGVGQGSTISYLLPLLIQSPVPIVGTMTYAQYNEFEKTYPSILQSFSIIRVDEVEPEDTFTILSTRITDLEQQYGISISFPALDEIIKVCQVYLPQKKFPKKAVEVLDQSVIQATRSRDKRLTREVVRQTVSEITKIPTLATNTSQASRLLDLEDKIHQKYINQEEAVHSIVESLQRSQTMLRNTKRPIGVFLFLGPSGVGKTELAKITAEEYFGGEYSIIRVDLSQFKNLSDTQSIVGMLEKVAMRPYGLVLLDEIEKAPQNVLDIFLRLFDEGILVSNRGENIYFNNTIIICTSNIGSDMLLQADPDQFVVAKQAILKMLPEYFRPEFINRFDKTLVFKPLSKDHVIQICILNLNELVTKLASQGITAEYSFITVNYIATIGYDPGMGARPIKRAIQDYIEANVARYILETQSMQGAQPNYINFDSIIDSLQNSTDNADSQLNSDT